MVDESPKEELPLLTPYKMGQFDLSHRVVLAPLTRCRSCRNVPQPHAAVYYTQRATRGGLISDATGVSSTAQEFPEIPGIWTQQQVHAWKPIGDAVHRSGALFFCQIWYATHDLRSKLQDAATSGSTTNNREMMIPGAELDTLHPKPRRLQTEEIPLIVDGFRRAARNAIEAGFDGVEIAHGFLLEQFMKDSSNTRADRYGGSLENRCRFAVEVIEAVVHEIGARRVGIKLSPFADYDMGCFELDPHELGVYMVQRLHKHQGFLCCNMVEPRMAILDGRR